MRMLLMKEDYVGACLVMTDCTNEELKAILDKVEQNDEDGIGQTVSEICEEMFPQCRMVELGCTEQSQFEDITELDTKEVAYSNYLTFSVVQSKE